MTELVVRVVDVYVYRRPPGGAPEFLLLRRSPGRAYAGAWRMVGGKIEPGEAAWQAARRELAEETGLEPRRFWTIPSVNTFYEWARDRVNVIPAFAAEAAAGPATEAALRAACAPGAEHDAWRWLPEAGAAARLGWPEQQRLVGVVAAMLRRPLPPELIVEKGAGQ